DQHAQVHDSIVKRVDPLRKCTAQGSHGTACRGFGRGIDEIGDGLGLSQIEPVVQKSTLGEFAGLGVSQAELAPRFQAALEQAAHDCRTAVALKLKNVFACVGMRRREKQYDARINRFALFILERQVVRVPWLKGLVKQTRSNGCQIGSRDANDAYAATSGRGGNGGDRLLRRGKIGRAAWRE